MYTLTLYCTKTVHQYIPPQFTFVYSVSSVLLLPVCAIVPFSDAWDGNPAHVAEQHALVANAVAEDTVHLPPGEGEGEG